MGEGSASRPGRCLLPGKDPIPIVQEAGWAPGPLWTGAENLAPTGIRYPDRPSRSQSLYRLSYTAHENCYRHLVFGTDIDKKYAYMLHVKEWFSVNKYKHGDHAKAARIQLLLLHVLRIPLTGRYNNCHCIYSTTSLIRINWYGKPSGHAKKSG